MMKIYISGNYIYEGRGYHGEVLEVEDYLGNKLINDGQAITLEKHEEQQREAKEKADRAAKAQQKPKKPFNVISPSKKTQADTAPGSNVV